MKTRVTLLAAFFLLVSGIVTSADTFTWNDTNGNWAADSNWNGGADRREQR
jgi:hypothetical protein